ncbi:MAG: hypothetical protein HY243_19180 [Proteobacteria bacterium]|nr:hypothetical protein [Pseudomonadota bacterium]
MVESRKNYPDNSLIFAQKAQGRSERAALSFAEKLAALDDLRTRVAPIIRAREARKRDRQAFRAADMPQKFLTDLEVLASGKR